MPLALSFVTFQQIAFLVDCYKQSKEREKAQGLESNVKNNRESQHSLTQTTLSITTAKEKRFIPSRSQSCRSPLNPKKNKATAFLFCNQGESLAISASSIKSAGDTTAPFKSDFMHHEAGESRNERKACNIDCMDFANAKYQKPTLDSSNAESNKDIMHINFLDYCLFITFFPQLIAGPIVHHKEMMPQFYAISRDSKICDKDLESRQLIGDSKIVEKNAENVFCSQLVGGRIFLKKHRLSPSGIPCFDEKAGLCSGWQGDKTCGLSPQGNTNSLLYRKKPTPNLINWEYIAKGLFIFSIGLFKKVVIADSFAKWANAGSKAIESGAMLNFFESWATALSHMFEYYFDFSGYCDMAIGLGLLFGIVLPINFNSPFKSLNIAEFWRRWHITLGRFLKHYVYIPLGGSRVPLIFNLRNLFLVFLISGIWHGAGFGFIIWGSIHGLSVVIHKLYTLFYKKLDSASLYVRFMRSRIYIVFCWLLTFMVVLLARVFYVSPNVKDAFALLKGMFF
uniref:MBOAT family O-acyltransferase n=1 Tax=Helicobacter cinaedi TaxID=213 RepID=UPI001F4513E5